MRVRVETRGVGDSAETVALIGRRAVAIRPALVKAQEILAQGEKSTFTLARGLRTPQRKDTAARKRRDGFASVAYRQSGDLEDSLTTAAGSGDAVRRITGDTLRFGSDVHYLAFQRDQLVRVPSHTARRLEDMVSSYLMTGALA